MGRTVGILSTDMSKAFDSLHPTLLLAKLKGFSQSTVKLMRSHFTDRVNRTRVDQAVSSWREINRGGPQGSALGPILWNIYQNGLFYIQLKSRLSAYADDHNFILPMKAQNKQSRLLLMMVRIFFREMLGNTKLWSYLSIPLDVVIDSVKIKLTEDKLLGVTIDRGLSLSEHISAACTKASMQVGVLMRLPKLISIKAKLSIYKAAILPYLTYSDLFGTFVRTQTGGNLTV